MKIAIDISPLQSGHKVRGVGFYLEYLKKSLVKYFPEHDYTFFKKKEDINNDVDLVHYPYFDPFFFTLPFVKRHKIVVTVHDLTPLVFPKHFPAGIKGSMRWKIQKFNLSKSEGIIADSFSSRNDVIKIIGVSDSIVDVAYLAAGEQFARIEKGDLRIEYLKKKYNLPEKFILYVGDATWNKNLPRLINAVKEINVTLVMVGKALAQKDFDISNPWNKDLLEVNKLIENDKRFIRLGFVPDEDLVTIYNTAALLVMPSLYEGFGLPVIEAMQSGCPVVTTKAGSLAEVAGHAVYFVDENDLYSIANGIGEVYYSEKIQKELRKKGLEQAKKFSWKQTAKRTIDAYEKALKD